MPAGSNRRGPGKAPGRCQTLRVGFVVGGERLLPPLSQYPVLTDEHLACYEMALDKFLSRNWAAAFELLHRIPSEDEVKDFLTVYIAEHNRRVPLNWDGVIPLESK